MNSTTKIIKCQDAIILSDSLIDKDLTNDGSIFINRESSWHQRKNHAPKMQLLQEAHAIFGNRTSFVPNCYTGTGNLRFLYDTGKKGRYFRWLRKLIEKGLRQTPQGTLYVFAVTFDRLFRPLGFDPHDTTTWTFTIADYGLVADWLVANFGSRAKDIVFVLLFEGTPGEVRGLATALGMHDRGNMGGRPPKIKKTRPDKITREWLQNLTVFLLEWGKSIESIHESFNRYGFTVALITVQRWAKKHGLNRQVGRPIKNAY